MNILRLILTFFLSVSFLSYGIQIKVNKNTHIKEKTKIKTESYLIKKLEKNRIITKSGKVIKINKKIKVIKNSKNPKIVELVFSKEKLIYIILK